MEVRKQGNVFWSWRINCRKINRVKDILFKGVILVTGSLGTCLFIKRYEDFFFLKKFSEHFVNFLYFTKQAYPKYPIPLYKNNLAHKNKTFALINSLQSFLSKNTTLLFDRQTHLPNQLTLFQSQNQTTPISSFTLFPLLYITTPPPSITIQTNIKKKVKKRTLTFTQKTILDTDTQFGNNRNRKKKPQFIETDKRQSVSNTYCHHNLPKQSKVTVSNIHHYVINPIFYMTTQPYIPIPQLSLPIKHTYIYTQIDIYNMC
eukprot:TRINITY_DN3673_c0_g1_i14.p1 TRINITY_DN3673_c0_g1~~TRINITY_DN3673_c0_g1_i14.p1  ORF type:complete len:260 (+),score=-8.54 TRINITY_DN3673_c0_g1_i14:51-830(+)